MVVEVRFPSGFEFRDNREAVARGSLWEDRAVATLLDFVFEVAALRDGHRGGFRPVVLRSCSFHNVPFLFFDLRLPRPTRLFYTVNNCQRQFDFRFIP
jgi:hypothetical protein